jgi:hypothetical protein
MKKSIVLLVMLFVLLSDVFCFDLSAGPKAGMSYGWQAGKDWDDYVDSLDFKGEAPSNKVKFGFSGGLFVNIGLIDLYAIQPEVIFSMCGGRFAYDPDGTGDIDGVVSANIIEVPILHKFRFSLGPGNLYLVAGPEIIFILGDVKTDKPVETEEAPDNFLVYGIVGGIGYELPLGPGYMSFALRIGRTLDEYMKDFYGFFTTNYIYVGYGFNLL